MAPESTNRPSNGLLGFLGVFVLLFAVTIVAIAFLAFLGKGGQTLEQRRAAGRVEVRTRLENEAQEKLNSEGWVDKTKGLVHVAINEAIPLTVKELRGKKPAPSQIKVEAPLPIFVPDPNSTEPPPPALPSSPQGADLIRFIPPATPEAAAPAPAPAAAAAPAPAAPVAPAPAAPAPAPVPAAPVPAPAPAAPAEPAPPAPAPAPAEQPAPPPVPAPAPAAAPAPTPAPAAAPEAPARPPLINPTENPK